MPVLEFLLDTADAPRLARVPGMAPPGRAMPISIEWHDTADAALARDGMVLQTTGRRWSLERLRAEHATAPATVIAEASRPDALNENLSEDLPDDLQRVAAFQGRRRRLSWAGDDGAVILRLLDGRFAGRSTPALCRLSLDGPAPAIHALSVQLAQDLAIGVPRATLSGQALAAAAGVALPPRALGAPRVIDGAPVTDSLSTIMGHLLDVMLHWSGKIGRNAGPEPVHQMRVATRRLRSALSIFKHAAPCPQLAGLSVSLRDCATRLGRARDWDVFLDGTGRRLAEAFPDDPRCAAMLRAGHRRRRQAYAELQTVLAGPDFRQLTVAVALATALRPWEADEMSEALTRDTALFAAEVLAKRAKRVRKAGQGIEALSIPALHELRKDCKRLRYSAEFFAPLFPEKPGRRYLKRLAELQEELGLLNDSAAISGLMAQLGRAERGYAAGLVEGFSMAGAEPARRRIVGEWKRFRAAEPFWTR